MPREPPLVPEEGEHSHRHPTDHIYRAPRCRSPTGPGRQEQRRSEVRGQRKLVLCLGPDPLLRLLSLPRKSGTQGAEGSPEPMTRWQEARRRSLGDHTTQLVSKPLLSFFLRKMRRSESRLLDKQAGPDR